MVLGNPYSAKPLHMIYDKLEESGRKYRAKYLGLLHSDEKFETTFDRIRYVLRKNQQFTM